MSCKRQQCIRLHRSWTGVNRSSTCTIQGPATSLVHTAGMQHIKQGSLFQTIALMSFLEKTIHRRTSDGRKENKRGHSARGGTLEGRHFRFNISKIHEALRIGCMQKFERRHSNVWTCLLKCPSLRQSRAMLNTKEPFTAILSIMRLFLGDRL